jgi:nitroreductase
MSDGGNLSIHDAIHTLRAMRRLRPDPVPEQEIRYVIECATQAASATNAQQWAFVVVRDAQQLRKLGELYLEIADELVRPATEEGSELTEETRKVFLHALKLAERMPEVPAMIVACMRERVEGEAASALASYYGSIFPAVQNLMLAARSRGLGTTLTTLHLAQEQRFKEILGIPESVQTVALIPIGYPTGQWKTPVRRDLDGVTHWDRWGEHAPN